MTSPSLPRAGRGGESRSAPPVPEGLRVLVTCGDPIVRDDWARAFEGMGMRVMRCAGHQNASCPVLSGLPCPLHASADLAVYDESLLDEEFLRRLRASPPATPLGFAEDRVRADGRHEPHVTHVFRAGALRGGGFHP